MNAIKRNVRPIVTGILLAISGIASAASVTLNGTDVSFTYDDANTGLFGSPTVSGNTIFFTPTDFKAVSTNGAGTMVTSSTVNVVITPHQGNALTSLSLTERGDYSLDGEGSSVGIGGQLRVFSMNDPINVEDSSFITTASNLTINDNLYHNWTAGAGVDLTGAQWSKTSAVNMTLENVLEATTSGSGPSKAFIEKKFAGVGITVGLVPPASVPIPAAMWLFGSGLLGLVGVARRERAIA